MVIKSYPKILLLGDSLTELSFGPGGYGAAMTADYAAKYDVLNRGYGGYESQAIWKKIKDDFYASGDPALSGGDSEAIELVIINLGTNDSTSNSVPIDVFRSNMMQLVDHFKSRHSAEVLLLTPSKVNTEMWENTLRSMGLPADETGKSNELHRQYADVVLEVAQDKSVPAIDLYKLFEEARASGLRDDELFTDGVHYTSKGYELITRALRKGIDAHLPHLSPPVVARASESFVFYCDIDPIKLEGLKAWCKQQGMTGEDYAAFWDAIQAGQAAQQRKQLVEETS